MKKNAILFATLLSTIGAWAEVAPLKVSTGAEKHYYVIKNLRSEKYACYEGDNIQLMQKAAPTSNETVNAFLWYVTAEGENYKLHNVATEKNYAAYNSFTPNGTTVYIKENPHRSGYVCISTTEDLSSNCWDDQGSHTTIGNYNPRQNDNEGTSWTMEEVNATEYAYTLSDKAGNVFTGTYDCCVFNGRKSLPRTKSVELDNIKWTANSISANIAFPFAVSSANVVIPTLIANGASWDNPNSKKWRAVEDDGVNYVKVQNAAVSTSNTDALWAIYPQLTEGCFKYTIKNVNTGTFIKASTTAVGDGNDVKGNTKPVTLEAEGTAFTYDLRSGNNWNFVYVNQSGTALKLSVNGAADEDVFLGVYSGGHSGNDIAFPDYTTEMSGFPINVSSWNKTNAMMISAFKEGYGSYQYGFKWYVFGSTVKIQRMRTATISTLADFTWAIYPMPVGSEMRYAIKHLGTNKFIKALPTFTQKGDHSGDEVVLSETPMYFAFENATSSFYYYPEGSSLKHYLSCNSTNTAAEQYLGVWTTNHNGVKNELLPLSYTFTVSSVGYATLYSPFAGTISGSSDVKTYAITIDDVLTGNGFVTLSERTGVAANQGAVVEAPEGTYTFTAAHVDSDWSSNLLMGTYVDTYIEGAAYVLSNGEGGVGLYMAAMNKNAEGSSGYTHFLNNAGKAFLPASSVPSAVVPLDARYFLFGSGTETGISETENGNVKTENGDIFDLSGRRVQKAQKGIFIVNGKKVIK